VGPASLVVERAPVEAVLEDVHLFEGWRIELNLPERHRRGRRGLERSGDFSAIDAPRELLDGIRGRRSRKSPSRLERDPEEGQKARDRETE
jgi:hypothetical protein